MPPPTAFSPTTPSIWVEHLHKSEKQNLNSLKRNKQKQTIDKFQLTLKLLSNVAGLKKASR